MKGDKIRAIKGSLRALFKLNRATHVGLISLQLFSLLALGGRAARGSVSFRVSATRHTSRWNVWRFSRPEANVRSSSIMWLSQRIRVVPCLVDMSSKLSEVRNVFVAWRAQHAEQTVRQGWLSHSFLCLLINLFAIYHCLSPISAFISLELGPPRKGADEDLKNELRLL